MKQLTERNKKIITSIIIAIILIGIVVTVALGFNKELKYKNSQRIDISIETEVDRKKVKEIANEVLGKNNMVETIEIYQDLISIRAEKITDEQKESIISKLKENYEFKQTAEDTEIVDVSETRIVDMYKKYVVPFCISGVLILVYMVIRYYKKGILKVLARTIAIPVIGELFLLSIITITRIPLGRFTPVLVICTYIATIAIVIRENEK